MPTRWRGRQSPFGTFDGVAGTSTALTVGGFNTTSDFIFYQSESAFSTNQIIATS